MGTQECWFCLGTARHQDRWRTGVHRDVKHTNFVVGTYTRWKRIAIDVPRCRRCHLSHEIERVLCVVFTVSAVLLAIPLLIWASNPSQWTDTWEFIPVAAWVLVSGGLWLSVRLRWFDVEWIAPERRSFVRAYPEIVELREEGWKYGLRP